jgi:3-dehydroquinate synthase
MTPDDFLRLMAVDKKNVDGSLRLVLLQSLGKAVITDEVDPLCLDETLNAYCSA